VQEAAYVVHLAGFFRGFFLKFFRRKRKIGQGEKDIRVFFQERFLELVIRMEYNGRN
jgi:hypothetical protein